ncbi:MAG: argininosuccinate synthase [Calditrichaeota bacterium]|nr:MAG: argininosuccinate synthase [Calditrichota bacterium]
MYEELSLRKDDFEICVAQSKHAKYAEAISQLIQESARVRSAGIARRTPEYIRRKILEGKAIIALHRGEKLAGFCYIETWSHGKYIANSGLIVAPEFRNQHVGKSIKEVAFKLSRRKYPHSKLFGLTTSHAVMNINSHLGYRPVPFSMLTQDDEFWEGCTTCSHYDILQRNQRKNCLCTAMLYDPQEKEKARAATRPKGLVVLAFSGGLDTSYCVKYLSAEKGLTVHTVTVQTGGFSENELADIEKQALRLGAQKHVVLNETQAYYERCVKYLIFGNILKNNTYPLSVSSERVFQAMAVAKYAREVGADFVAHGSTGAGNDQVRFDLIFHALVPEMPILTPIRDQQISRNAELAYLASQGIEMNGKAATYSINKGLWGTSVGGVETLTSHQYLPEEAFPTPLSKTQPEPVELGFVQGELQAINGQSFEHPVEAIRALEQMAAPFGIGRDIHVGDTIIGIKGRVGFEAAAPMIIIKSHHALEKHVLSKWQLHWKEQLAGGYGMLLHEGQFLDPVMRDMEKFLENSQQRVTGTVSVLLAPHRFQVLGITSPYDLMSPEFASYGEMNLGWTADEVRGFARILANQTRIHQKVSQKNAR